MATILTTMIQELNEYILLTYEDAKLLEMMQKIMNFIKVQNVQSNSQESDVTMLSIAREFSENESVQTDDETVSKRLKMKKLKRNPKLRLEDVKKILLSSIIEDESIVEVNLLVKTFEDGLKKN